MNEDTSKLLSDKENVAGYFTRVLTGSYGKFLSHLR